MPQQTAQYFDLSHFSMLEISGKDAFDFLHGQFICDLNDLENHGWLLSGWCLPNGKTICTFIIFSIDKSFFLILPSMLKDKILKRLTMYVLRSDVSITDVSDNYALLGFSGKNIKEIIDPHGLENAFVKNKLCFTAGFSLLTLWDNTPRYIMISKIETITEIMNQITSTCIAGERTDWSLMDIEAGIPWITNAISENFLPQMLNIDQMHGMSLKKGCYPGQEIIARLHYRGQLKKRMYLGYGDSMITPGPGDRLENKDTKTNIGEIIDAERDISNGFKFLAVVDTEYASNSNLVLSEMPDASVNLQEITYPV